MKRALEIREYLKEVKEDFTGWVNWPYNMPSAWMDEMKKAAEEGWRSPNPTREEYLARHKPEGLEEYVGYASLDFNEQEFKQRIKKYNYSRFTTSFMYFSYCFKTFFIIHAEYSFKIVCASFTMYILSVWTS